MRCDATLPQATHWTEIMEATKPFLLTTAGTLRPPLPERMDHQTCDDLHPRQAPRSREAIANEVTFVTDVKYESTDED